MEPQYTRSDIGDTTTSLMGHVADVLLATSLYGVYTCCVFLSIIVLTRHGLRKIPTTILLCIVVVMLASTTVGWVTNILNVLLELDMVISASGLACLSDPDSQTCTPITFHSLGPNRKQLQHCAWASALTINIICSDLIVWWRVYVVWGRSKMIIMLGLVSLSPSIVLRLIASTYRCTCQSTPRVVIILEETVLKLSAVRELDAGSLFIGSLWGLMGNSFSMLVNLMATGLITCKAWQHRRFVHQYLRAASSKSQAERVMALLIESGVAYCAIWIVAMTYHILSHDLKDPTQVIYTHNRPWFLFMVALETFTSGALPTLIAIYPTLIILVVALKAPQWERNYYAEPSIEGSAVVQTPHIAHSIKPKPLPRPSAALIIERGPDAE